MKKFIIVIFILFFFQNILYAEDDVIWDYNNDEFIKELLQGNSSESEAAKQRILDEEISKNLGIDLVYTNLSECLKIALDNNYAIKNRYSVQKQHYWEYKNANTQFLPNVSYQYTLQYIDGKFLVGGVLIDKFDELPMQNIWLAEWKGTQQGKVFFLNAQKKHTLNASKSTLEFTRDEIILKTSLAYYDLLSQKMRVEVYKSNLIDRIYQYKLVKARFDAGLENKYYVTRAETEVATAKQAYITGFNNLRLLQAKLANLMGIEVLYAIYPSESSIQLHQLVEDKYSIDSLYDMALLTRDDLRAARLRIEALKAERSSNYMDFAPDTYAAYQRAIVGTPKSGFGPGTVISLFVTVPLGKNLGLGTATTIKAFNARIEAEQFSLTELTRSVKESILGSYYNSKSALEKIESAKKAVKSSEESVKISLMRAKVGQGVYTDVIQAQTLKIAAQEQLIQNIIEYNKAQTQLLFDTGIISVSGVLKGYNASFNKMNP